MELAWKAEQAKEKAKKAQKKAEKLGKEKEAREKRQALSRPKEEIPTNQKVRMLVLVAARFSMTH